MWIKAQAKQSLEETVDREKRERGTECVIVMELFWIYVEVCPSQNILTLHYVAFLKICLSRTGKILQGTMYDSNVL